MKSWIYTLMARIILKVLDWTDSIREQYYRNLQKIAKPNRPHREFVTHRDYKTNPPGWSEEDPFSWINVGKEDLQDLIDDFEWAMLYDSYIEKGEPLTPQDVKEILHIHRNYPIPY